VTSVGLSDIDAAVLAGGLGTRVAHCLGDLPKIMAPFGDRSFLEVLLTWLHSQGVHRVVLCLGHRHEAVLAYLQRRPPNDMKIVCSVEPEPLGTAGALAHARPLLRSDPVLVMNGDTLLQSPELRLATFLDAFHSQRARLAVLATQVNEAGRYGSMEIDQLDRVTRFREKNDGKKKLPHWVSAGVYLLSAELLDEIAALKRGSLEYDVFEHQSPRSIYAFRVDGHFFDIGTPAALEVARAGFGGGRAP
jgi:NDP-sugar pyrophosphorylase family protein